LTRIPYLISRKYVNHIELVDIHRNLGDKIMKELIGLVRLGALTALSVALYGAHRQTEAAQTTHSHFQIPDRQAGREGELVLLDLDGTVIAREVNLMPHSPFTNSAADVVQLVRANLAGRS
jgi:hypothetical protein